MKNVRWFPVVAVLFVCVPLFAQKEDEAARERQRRIAAVAESLIADARQMTLPENRAFVFANTGSRLWEADQKRSQELFDDAITELLAAQAEAEIERRKGRQSELLTSQSTRPYILRTIAGRNAEFALQSLYRTRPAAVERAILNANPKDSKMRSSPGNDSYLVQNELNLEHWLMRTAAEQSPERAVALLQAALKKGVTGEALSLLRKLHEKNPAAAAEMSGEVVGRLMAKSFMAGSQIDYSTTQAAFSFLNEHVRERPPADKSFRFNAGEMKALADKLIAFYLEKSSQVGYGYGQQLVPIAEKLRPDAVAKIKELDRSSPRYGLISSSEHSEYNRLINHETPLEQVIAEAPKVAAEMRPQVYQNVVGRLVAAGEVARARQIVSENFSDEAFIEAQANLNWHLVHSLINHGKFADAEVLIDQMPDNTRFSAMISLSDTAFNRDPVENKSFSLGILSKAAGGISVPLENSTDMQQIMQLIAAYTRVEPAEAFRIFEGLVPQINELNEAALVINAFTGNNSRRGEMIISMGGGNGVNIDGSVIRGLSQKDFDRAWSLIGTFSRRETRMAFKQQILESI